MVFLLLIAFAVVSLIFFKLYRERLYIAKFPNRYVVITGCDQGFGYDLAVRLCREKFHVFAGCLTKTGCAKLSKACKDLSGNLTIIELDVRSDESVQAALAIVKEETHGEGIWALVNNAGIAGPIVHTDFLSVEDYALTFDVNVYGTIRMCLAFASLVRPNRGRIVNMGSIYGFYTMYSHAPYVASKHALLGFSHTLRLEQAAFGVRVIVVEPQYFNTAMNRASDIMDVMHKRFRAGPAAAQEEYGEEFLCKTANAIPGMMIHLANPKVGLVEDAYFHAIAARHPRSRYCVGFLSYVYRYVSGISTDLLDLFTHIGQLWFAEGVRPARIAKSG